MPAIFQPLALFLAQTPSADVSPNQDLWGSLLESISSAPGVAIGIASLVLVGMAIIVITLLRLYARRKLKSPQTTAVDLSVDVARLGLEGPPATGPQLELYNVPMRLAMLVLAPAGRAGKLPNKDIELILEEVVPGLGRVVETHQPDRRLWPPQLSSQGFAAVIANNIHMPGDGGKGSPWCTIAGKMDSSVGPLLVGMVLRAEKANQLGQVEVKHFGEWLDALRVKNQS